MNQSEFKTYMNDFRLRFPDAAEWIGNFPETLQVWFEDCFAALELEDCLQANVMLQNSEDDFRWGRLPRVVMKVVGRIVENRYRREANERTMADSVGKTGRSSGKMKKALESIEALRKQRQESGNPVEPQELKSLVDQWFSLNDPGCDEEEPSYKCPDCRDTGWRSYRDHKGRLYAGPCGDCEYGTIRFKKLDGKVGLVGKSKAVEWNY